ncbi:DNA cytosine methyltransferase [Tsukamurella pseudospumae]|uniref:DNA (cytosine-5-)-methyltransferase n=1 Tax=Tsukamurella pseudospumae TaxID=239498 RepID=A0A137YX30_9ACTN|nr:DNA cytosine methyltransferase [Tsukamurella pseudospumae]KXO90512.1 DNA methylase [Tsukamurella pseudospumae]
MSDTRLGQLPRLASPRIVDLFAGPGGLDVAAHWLGIESVGIEFDSAAIETRIAAQLPTQAGDVRHFGPSDFTGYNVLTGGPPCQTFTVAGHGAGRRALDTVLDLVDKLGAGKLDEVDHQVAQFDDERTGLVLQPLLWALTASTPYEAIVMEQVPAVLPVWEAVAGVLETHGYGVDTGILRTEEFGVPQTRRRAVLIARRGVPSECISLPTPTHMKYQGKGRPSVVDAGVAHWETMGGVLPHLAPFTVVSNYGTGGDARARGRRTSDLPAFTVTGKVSRNKVLLADGTETRFSMNEAGRLQTFPIDYPWSGGDISQQVGNAVPPRLGVHVLSAVLGISEADRDVAISEVEFGWTPSRYSAMAM